MRKVISALIVFCVLSAVLVFDVSGASIAISNLSKKTAGPFDVIKIYGAGFTAAADLSVIFAKGAYAVTVPAIYGTNTTLEVGVPFFFDTKTGAIKSGVVKVTVKSKSLGIKSNTLTGFTITDLPRTTEAAGTVTQAFLKDLQTLTVRTKGQLDFLQKASKGKVDTTRAKSGVSKMATNLSALQTDLAGIQKRQAATLGSSIIINKASLAVSDRIILGFLAQLEAVVKAPSKMGVTAALGRDWIPPDGLSIPGLLEIYGKLASYAEEKGFDRQVLFEYLKRSGAWVGTATGALTVLGYLGAVSPAVAAVAGGVGLAYGIGVTCVVIAEYGCYYFGLPSGVDEAEGFWPLLGDVSRTLLQMVPFPLGKFCRLKRLLDALDLALNERDVVNALENPVKEAAPAIIPELLRITVEGSWVGKICSPTGQSSFKANFTESGLSITGKIEIGGKGYWRDVSGALCGYLVSFDYDKWTASGGVTAHEILEFTGNLSGSGESMAGTYGFYVKFSNSPKPIEENGTWILYR